MSACFDLVLIGALLQQLWIILPCSSSGSSACFAILCWFWQRFNPVYPPVSSMSLKPKRCVAFLNFSLKPFGFFNFVVNLIYGVWFLIFQGLFWNTKLSTFSYKAIFFPLLILESGSYLIPP